jgi:type IV pilus assembly protein PilM
MKFLPRTSGARPRLACELRSEGVVAARAEDASDVLTAVSRVTLNNVILPLVRVGEAPGSHVFGSERAAVVAAIRKAVDSVSQRARDLTLIVPDAAVRESKKRGAIAEHQLDHSAQPALGCRWTSRPA